VIFAVLNISKDKSGHYTHPRKNKKGSYGTM